MSERLRLVKSFDELREGMIVVVTPLDFCSCGKHRAMLMPRRDNGPVRVNAGPVVLPAGTPGYELSPKPRCTDMKYSIISEHLVSERKVWRVLDGLEAESSPGTAAGADRTTHARENA